MKCISNNSNLTTELCDTWHIQTDRKKPERQVLGTGNSSDTNSWSSNINLRSKHWSPSKWARFSLRSGAIKCHLNDIWQIILRISELKESWNWKRWWMEVGSLTFIGHRQCAAQVLLLKHPWCIIQLGRDATWPHTVDFNGCKRAKRNKT